MAYIFLRMFGFDLLQVAGRIKLAVMLIAIASVITHVFFACSPYLAFGSNISTIGSSNYILSDETPYPCDGSTDGSVCTFVSERQAAQVCDRDTSCLGYFTNVKGTFQLFRAVPNASVQIPATHNIGATPIKFNMEHLSTLKLPSFVAIVN